MNQSKPTIKNKYPEPALGLECPKCGCRHLPVWYTRKRPGHILRVRKCRHCERRVATRERI